MKVMNESDHPELVCLPDDSDPSPSNTLSVMVGTARSSSCMDKNPAPEILFEIPFLGSRRSSIIHWEALSSCLSIVVKST